MARKYLLVIIIITTALIFVSCGNKNSPYSTDNLKKYVEKMKKKQTYSDEKTKKALKSIFPKMKVD